MYTGGRPRPAGAAGTNEGTGSEGRRSRVARLQANAAAGRMAVEERGRGGRSFKSVGIPRVMRFCPRPLKLEPALHLPIAVRATSTSPKALPQPRPRLALLRKCLRVLAGPLRSRRSPRREPFPRPRRLRAPLPALWHHSAVASAFCPRTYLDRITPHNARVAMPPLALLLGWTLRDVRGYLRVKDASLGASLLT